MSRTNLNDIPHETLVNAACAAMSKFTRHNKRKLREYTPEMVVSADRQVFYYDVDRERSFEVLTITFGGKFPVTAIVYGDYPHRGDPDCDEVEQLQVVELTPRPRKGAHIVSLDSQGEIEVSCGGWYSSISRPIGDTAPIISRFANA